MKRREQLLLLGVACAAVLVAFYVGVLSPKLKQSSSLGKTLVTVQQRRDAAVAAVANAQAAERGYVSNVQTINSLTPAIPPTDSTSPLLRVLDAAAAKTHVDFTTITLVSSGQGTNAAARPGAAAAATSPNGIASAPTPAVPPGYSLSSALGIPSVQYTLKFGGDYLKLQRFLGALHGFVRVANGSINAKGRLLDVQGVSVTKGIVTMTVVGYLLGPNDQSPLPVPQNAPVVPGVQRASTTPGQGTTKVASAGGGRS